MQLQQIIAIPLTNAGITAQATVELHLNPALSVTPDIIAFDNGAFDYVSLVGTTLTVINNGTTAGTTNVWLIYFHSPQRSYGGVSVTQLSPAPFVIRGASAITGAFSPAYAIAIKAPASPQIVSSGGTATLTFTTETSSGISYNAGQSRFTILNDGIYEVTVNAHWGETNPVSGTLETFILVNGSASDSATAYEPVKTVWGNATTQITTLLSLTAGQTVLFQVFQNTGSDQTVLAAEGTLHRVA